MSLFAVGTTRGGLASDGEGSSDGTCGSRHCSSIYCSVAVCQRCKNQEMNSNVTTYRYVDQRDARPEVRVRLIGVNKRMLAPVANHEAHTHEQKRGNKDKGGGLAVESVHGADVCIVGHLPERRLESIPGLSLPQEVERQVEPDHEEEAADVVKKVENVVTLVSNSRGEIVGPVAFDVMVLDMVVKVRVPCMSHERIRDIRENFVDNAENPSLRQDSVHVDVLVHHQGVCPCEPKLHQHVEDAVEVVEVAEQQDGARY